MVRRSFLIDENGVRGSASRRIVCLPRLKRRVQAVGLGSSLPWRLLVSCSRRAESEGNSVYHLVSSTCYCEYIGVIPRMVGVGSISWRWSEV